MVLIMLAFIVGIAASILGGVIGGVIVGGKHIGNELAALMGGFYGPLAGIVGTALGLVTVIALQGGGI